MSVVLNRRSPVPLSAPHFCSYPKPGGALLANVLTRQDRISRIGLKPSGAAYVENGGGCPGERA
jgi:hypothetical protein